MLYIMTWYKWQSGTVGNRTNTGPSGHLCWYNYPVATLPVQITIGICTIASNSWSFVLKLVILSTLNEHEHKYAQ